MTRNDLDAAIDLKFNDSVADESIKPSDEATTMKLIADYIDQFNNEYSILLTQTGTNTPIATYTFRDTITGINIVRNSIGNYSWGKTGAFPFGKTKITPTSYYSKLTGKQFYISHESEDLIRMLVRDDSGAFADLNATEATDFTIKIYP